MHQTIQGIMTWQRTCSWKNIADY